MDFVVYYDDDYPSWWIERALSKRIAHFLSKRNFRVENAHDLAKWMKSSIEKKTCPESLVVFSQDVIPDTICHSPAPSCLARAFLDSGGTIVWVGDNPFYYQGLSSTAMKAKKHEEIANLIQQGIIVQNKAGEFALPWSLGGPYGVLGVIPVFMHSPSNKVKITRKGAAFRLGTSWYGNRPIIKKGETLHKRLSVLGSSKPILPISTKKILLQSEAEKGVSFPRVARSLSDLLGLVPAFATAGAVVLGLIYGWFAAYYWDLVIAAIASAAVYAIYWYIARKETLASAWLKNFNDDYPESGFLRIWDFEPYEITDAMLQDLYNVSVHQSKV